MSRKNFIKSFILLDNADLTASHTSVETNVVMVDKAGFYITWSNAAAVGEIVVEARITDPNLPLKAGDWFSLDFGSAIAINAAANQSIQIILNELQFTDMRIRYIPTSGTGTINARLSTKSVGA